MEIVDVRQEDNKVLLDIELSYEELRQYNLKLGEEIDFLENKIYP